MKENLVRPVKIGRLSCSNNLFLAPMAGITDPPFRRMCLDGGAGLVFGEMTSALALKYGNKKTEKLLELESGAHPVALQIFGPDAAALSLAAKKACQAGADVVDINCGCPVKKIAKSGAGAVLMRDERLFGAIVRETVRASSSPVTVKIRIGFKRGEIISPALARIAEAEGAAAVALHGRPVDAMHSGPVDYDAIAATAAAVKIPVIGNGGVCSAADAKKMFETGCSAVMIGRAAIGNPGIFSALESALGGGPEVHRPPRAAAAKFLELVRENCRFYGEREGMLRSRKVAGFWLKGFDGASSARSCFVKLDSLLSAEALLSPFAN